MLHKEKGTFTSLCAFTGIEDTVWTGLNFSSIHYYLMVQLVMSRKSKKMGRKRIHRKRKIECSRWRVAKITKKNKVLNSQDRYLTKMSWIISWKEKTTYMHSHMHSCITHTHNILTTLKGIHMCTGSAAHVSSTGKKAQMTLLLVCAHTQMRQSYAPTSHRGFPLYTVVQYHSRKILNLYLYASD